jgi:hypothetical protein
MNNLMLIYMNENNVKILMKMATLNRVKIEEKFRFTNSFENKIL